MLFISFIGDINSAKETWNHLFQEKFFQSLSQIKLSLKTIGSFQRQGAMA